MHLCFKIQFCEIINFHSIKEVQEIEAIYSGNSEELLKSLIVYKIW